MLCNGIGVLPHLQIGIAVMGFVNDLCYSLHNSKKYIFCPIWNISYENVNLKTNYSKIEPPNGVLPITKLLFPNESYRDGVYKALWAL